MNADPTAVDLSITEAAEREARRRERKARTSSSLTPRRYALFCGKSYYPEGGWHDFNGWFGSVKEAVLKAFKLKLDWWHIVDTRTGTIIARSN